MSELQSVVNKLNVLMDNFTVDAKKLTNKAAARRARKVSMEIERAMKEFRTLSVK